VATALVAEAEFSDRLEAIGTARARESVVIASKLSEKILRVRFESGQQVQAGELLVDLDLGSDQAELAAAETALREAERQLARQQQLAERRLIPQSQLDTQRAARDNARAQVDSARANLADRAIRAPFAGVLGLRQVSPGQLIGPNTPITTLDDLSSMKVEVRMPERALSGLRPGVPVVARSEAWPDREFQGQLSEVDTRIDAATRSVTVRAEIPNPEGLLRPGMLLRIELLQPARRAIVVPELAVQQVGSRSFVYRLDGEGKVEEADVRIGSRAGGQAEILEGLRADDRIVVEGTVKLRPGQVVREAGAAAGTPPAPAPAAQPGG
jgi:membrane fusion protein (multidrug efflux system)